MTNFKLTGILGDVTAFLTILAALPYELGAVADILPPPWKKGVATAGLIATLILRLIKRGQQQAAADALAATAAGLATTATDLAAANAVAAAVPAVPIQPQQPLAPLPVVVTNAPDNAANVREAPKNP